MYPCLPAIISAFFISSFLCANPGVQVRLTRDGFTRSINQILPDVNQILEDFKLDTVIDTDELKMWNIRAKVKAIKPEQVKTKFSEESQTFAFELKDFTQDCWFDMEIKKKIVGEKRFVKTGKASVSILIDKVTTVFSFKDFDPTDPVPYLDVKIGEFSIKKKNFTLKVSLKYVPDFVMKFLMKIFKSKILKQFVDMTQLTVQEMVRSNMNAYIKQVFLPTNDVPGTNIALSSGIIEKPRLTQKEIVFSMDGTFYDKDEGYVYRPEPKRLAFPESEKSSIIAISNTTVESLIQALNGFVYKFPCSVADCKVVLRSTDPKFSISKEQYVIENFKFDFAMMIYGYESTVSATTSAFFTISEVDHEKKQVIVKVQSVQVLSFVTLLPELLESTTLMIVQSQVDRMVAAYGTIPIDIFLIPPQLDFASFEFTSDTDTLIAETNFLLQPALKMTLEAYKIAYRAPQSNKIVV